MKSYFLSFFGLTLLAFSCNLKEENVIAINVLLTPDQKMQNHAVYLNKLMAQDNPETMIFDSTRIPHITLLQAYILEKDLPKMTLALNELHSSISSENLIAANLVFSREKNPSFAMIRIRKSKTLLELHEEVIAIVAPYTVKNGSEKSFVPNTDGRNIDQFTIDYVPMFIEKYSYDNYDPHLSLGVAKIAFLDSISANEFLTMDFKASSLRVYQLGEYGTAQKLLWQAE